jgi:hypothetical protein
VVSGPDNLATERGRPFSESVVLCVPIPHKTVFRMAGSRPSLVFAVGNGRVPLRKDSRMRLQLSMSTCPLEGAEYFHENLQEDRDWPGTASDSWSKPHSRHGRVGVWCARAIADLVGAEECRRNCAMGIPVLGIGRIYSSRLRADIRRDRGSVAVTVMVFESVDLPRACPAVEDEGLHWRSGKHSSRPGGTRLGSLRKVTRWMGEGCPLPKDEGFGGYRAKRQGSSKTWRRGFDGVLVSRTIEPVFKGACGPSSARCRVRGTVMWISYRYPFNTARE